MSISIHPATEQDLPAIVAIYNQAIAQKGLTADLDLLVTEDRLEWYKEHTEQYPVLMAFKDNKAVGWVSLSAYRKGRRALNKTAEISLYIDMNHLGQGIGTDMMNCMISLAKEKAYHNLIAILIGTNERSIGLFKKFGFELWGKMPQIIEIDGQKADHCFYGRNIEEA